MQGQYFRVSLKYRVTGQYFAGLLRVESFVLLPGLFPWIPNVKVNTVNCKCAYNLIVQKKEPLMADA